MERHRLHASAAHRDMNERQKNIPPLRASAMQLAASPTSIPATLIFALVTLIIRSQTQDFSVCQIIYGGVSLSLSLGASCPVELVVLERRAR